MKRQNGSQDNMYKNTALPINRIDRIGDDGTNQNVTTISLVQQGIPNKFQYLLEQISQCFHNLNLSELFMPYACYSNGQLYYRFYKMNPIFCRTYSIVQAFHVHQITYKCSLVFAPVFRCKFAERESNKLFRSRCSCFFLLL